MRDDRAVGRLQPLAWTLAACIGGLGIVGPEARAGVRQEESPELPEYTVKAGFIYNFAKYVEWPVDAFELPQSPIRIGISGEDPFGETLEKSLKNKRVNNRSFTIQRFKDPAAIQPCHILFIPRTEKQRWATILDQVRKQAVLTVGEDKGFTQAGGVVSILIEAQKPRLEVNPDAAGEQRVSISSKLLKVATIVRTEK